MGSYTFVVFAIAAVWIGQTGEAQGRISSRSSPTGAYVYRGGLLNGFRTPSGRSRPSPTGAYVYRGGLLDGFRMPRDFSGRRDGDDRHHRRHHHRDRDDRFPLDRFNEDGGFWGWGGYGDYSNRYERRRPPFRQQLVYEFPFYPGGSLPPAVFPDFDDPEAMSVTDMQLALAALGYYRGPIDGIVGPAMLQAMERFRSGALQ